MDSSVGEAVPKGFDEGGRMGKEGMVDVDANSGRKAWEARPAIEKVAAAAQSVSPPPPCLLANLLDETDESLEGDDE